VEQKARGAPEKQGMLLLDYLTDISHKKQKTGISKNRYLGFIPVGMTSELQVLDVMANTPFKNHLKQYYKEWLLIVDHALTPAGRIKRSSVLLLCQWSIMAGQFISPEVIV
jgi:hypothetical protein